MPVFHYEARTATGQPRNGREEAGSAGELARQLRGRGLLVLRVRSDAEASSGLSLASLNPFSWLPPGSLDVELFMHQLAVMLRSGITLLAALRNCAEQARRPSMTRACNNIIQLIQQGSSLSDAMAKHRCFGHLPVQLVRVGEQTGTLDAVLVRAAETLERRRLLRNQLLTALMYPTIVFVAAIGVAGFIVLHVIPKVRVFLQSLGRPLPPLTQRLVDISDWIQRYLSGIAIGLLVLIVLTYLLYRWHPTRLIMDRWLLRVPIIGFLFRLAITVQFAHVLAVMLRSGVTLVEGLRTLETLFQNRHAAACVAAARASVLSGSGLAPALNVPGLFMPMLSRMAAVGESAGTLDEMLGEVARFHEDQLQGTIRRFSTLIEPVIIVVVGGIVGFVYVAFYVALIPTGNVR